MAGIWVQNHIPVAILKLLFVDCHDLWTSKKVNITTQLLEHHIVYVRIMLDLHFMILVLCFTFVALISSISCWTNTSEYIMAFLKWKAIAYSYTLFTKMTRWAPLHTRLPVSSHRTCYRNIIMLLEHIASALSQSFSQWLIQLMKINQSYIYE